MKGLNYFLCYGVVMLMGAGITSSAAMAAGSNADPAQQIPVPPIVEQSCGACHGSDGNSIVPAFPKLAAQVSQYTEKQLQDFVSGARIGPIMTGIAQALSDAQIQELAQYFSQQVNKNTAQPDTQLLAQGEKIYRGGVVATKVPACAACHGPTAIGLPPLYPGLAGQNAAYIESQLLAFRSNNRSNDLRAVMREIAGNLTTQESKAVAAYLGSLP